MHYGVDSGSRRLAVACPAIRFTAEIRLPDPTKKRPADPHRELRDLLAWFTGVVPADAHLWVEAPFVGRTNGNMRTAIRLGMTVGAVLSAHPGPAQLVDQSSWKAAVVGHGNAGKDDVRRWLQGHHPALAAVAAESQDRIDATCIALHGERLASQGELLGLAG